MCIVCSIDYLGHTNLSFYPVDLSLLYAYFFTSQKNIRAKNKYQKRIIKVVRASFEDLCENNEKIKIDIDH